MNLRIAIATFATAVALLGCTSAVERVEPGQPVAATQGKTFIFGRIAYFFEGEAVPYSEWSGPLPHALIQQLETGETSVLSLEEDGSFYAAAPPGTYLVTKVAMKDYPRAVFKVPNDARAVYVGTLRMNARRSWMFFGHEYRLTSAQSVDEFEKARQALARRNATISGDIAKSRFVSSAEIPDADEVLARIRKRDSALSFLNFITQIINTAQIR